jgi:protein TonB
MAGWQHSNATERQDRMDPADPARSPAEIGNVVPFPCSAPNGARQSVSPIVPITPDRSPRAASTIRGRALYGGLLAMSLATHAALLIFLNREPTSAPSLGEEVISVEIVIGANTQAGNAERPSDADADNPAIEPDTQKPQTETTQDAKPEGKPVEPETARAAEEPQETATESVPSNIAAAPEERPQEKPVQETIRREPAPHPVVAPKPKTPAAPSVASRGVGRGSSASDANYSARVAAHLARFKRFPAEARARGQRGSTMVSFAFDGNGRVTSARLVRGSGSTLLDNEVVAMVHRASPFPRPPDGRPKNFTAPVSFQLN